MSFFSEAELPGIGKKISCTTHSKENAVIIIHNDGKREFYIMDKQGEPQAGIALLDEEARRLGSFLTGALYKPKAIEDLESALEDIKIDWFKISADSPVIGKELGSLELRKKTQISIIAVINKGGFTPNPDSSYVFNEGDTCVVIGRPERFGDFIKIISERQGME